MCELFAMSAGQNYTAQDYLPVFADKSRTNISGWGIGFFRGGQVPHREILRRHLRRGPGT